MAWLAGAIVLATFVGTLVAARALKASPYNVAGGLVMATAALAWLAMILVETYPPGGFRDAFFIYSSLACVIACVFAFTRRLIWPIFPLFYFGRVLLLVWAIKDGLPRLF